MSRKLGEKFEFARSRMNQGFIKIQRTTVTEDLLRDPKAMHLLLVIALRARYSSEPNLHGLPYGAALIGDWKHYGLSRGEERAARRRLEQYGLASFSASRLGTIATLLDSRVFSLRDERKTQKGDHPNNQRSSEPKGDFETTTSATAEPQPSHQTTTNKKESTEEGKNPNQSPTASVSDVEIPDSLKTSEFISVWNRWEGNRRKGRKPQEGWNALFCEQLRWLESLGLENAMLSVGNSVRSVWRSLYPPTPGSGPKSHAVKSQFAEAF